MKFLSILFGLCALLSLAWLCGGTIVWQSGVQIAQTPTNADPSTVDIAKSITGGLGVGFFACTGLPAAAIFALLSLACNGAYQTERRHQEMLTAQYNRNEALGNMTEIQLAQAKMQFQQMQAQRPYQQPRIYNEFPDEKPRLDDAPRKDDFEMRRQEFIRDQQRKRQEQADKFKRK